MIPFEEARRVILENAKPLGIVRRSLRTLRGLVLAETVYAAFDLPRFNNSAVDGFGVKVADLQTASPEKPVTLQMVDTIQAGASGKVSIRDGETVKILTGAPVPASVEAVVMQEFTEQGADGMVRFFRAAQPGEHIRLKGEEFKKGQSIIPAGTVITPPVIGLLANLGQAVAKVYRKPKVGLISTGNELVQPGKPLAGGQIYDSNTYALSAALQAVGLDAARVYSVRDERKATLRAFQKALKENDVVISLGGISVGEFDFVKDVAEQLGIETLFWRIAIKPGKPVYFGKTGKKLVFGLPGNPVSALVTYHQLVQPALLKMLGYPRTEPARMRASLTRDLRKRAGRQEFVRAHLTTNGADFTVTPSVGQDSHMLGGLAVANCLIDFPVDAEYLKAGQLVDIDLLEWMPRAFD